MYHNRELFANFLHTATLSGFRMPNKNGIGITER